MKVYLIGYCDAEGGHMEAFSAKSAAKKRYSELRKDDSTETLFDITETEFDISAKGIIDAIEYGARHVYK